MLSFVCFGVQVTEVVNRKECGQETNVGTRADVVGVVGRVGAVGDGLVMTGSMEGRFLLTLRQTLSAKPRPGASWEIQARHK